MSTEWLRCRSRSSDSNTSQKIRNDLKDEQGEEGTKQRWRTRGVDRGRVGTKDPEGEEMFGRRVIRGREGDEKDEAAKKAGVDSR